MNFVVDMLVLLGADPVVAVADANDMLQLNAALESVSVFFFFFFFLIIFFFFFFFFQRLAR